MRPAKKLRRCRLSVGTMPDVTPRLRESLSSSRALSQDRSQVVYFFVQQIQFSRQSPDVRGSAAIHIEIQLASQPVFRKLTMIISYFDRLSPTGC
jgi:hypothetical protein